MTLEKIKLDNTLGSEREANNRAFEALQREIRDLKTDKKILQEKLRSEEVRSRNAEARASTVVEDYKKLTDYDLDLLEMSLSACQLGFGECKRMVKKQLPDFDIN